MAAEHRLDRYRHKVSLDGVARPPAAPEPTFREWFAGLPSILAGNDLREVVERWDAARRAGRPVIWGFGAHVVKAGLSPWLIALMEAGLITRLAVNGAVAIHDYELAAVGHTSEEVGEALAAGVFGRAEETARFINQAAVDGAKDGLGLGAALCRSLARADLPHREASVLAAAARLGIPLTVHLALGTDTVHAHASADGAALGATTLADFRDFAAAMRGLEGGLYVNAGSAVLLPEIFLKAVSLARADGIRLDGLSTVVIDFIRHYRPLENVVRRPVEGTGKGFYLLGHHEVLIPLLGQAVLDRRRSAP